MKAARRQRGIALLVALLTVALAAVLIAGLLDRGELAFARTRNALRNEQAEAYSQGLEAYAARVLVKDSEDTGDSNTDIWAMPLPPELVPGGAIRGSMRDLNGCFNLNNLASQRRADTWKKMFVKLLEVRGVDPSIADAVRDWLGVSNNVDATDAYYLAQPVPYRSGQRAFAHVSELRLVRGVTSEVYARLAPYVCALPTESIINVNTASVPVLRSLGPNISEAQAEALWDNGQAHNTGTFRSEWSGKGVVLFPDVKADRHLVRGRIAGQLRRLVVFVAILRIQADRARLDVPVGDTGAFQCGDNALHPLRVFLERPGGRRGPRHDAGRDDREVGNTRYLTGRGNIEPRPRDRLRKLRRNLSKCRRCRRARHEQRDDYLVHRSIPRSLALRQGIAATIWLLRERGLGCLR